MRMEDTTSTGIVRAKSKGMSVRIRNVQKVRRESSNPDWWEGCGEEEMFDVSDG